METNNINRSAASALNSKNAIRPFAIWWARLPKLEDSSVQAGFRPVIITSNAMCCQHSPTISVVPMTSKTTKARLSTHVLLDADNGLEAPSLVLCEQITTIDKYRLINPIGYVRCKEDRDAICRALALQLSMAAA